MSRQQVDGIHLLRCVSCFLIVVLHVSAPYFSEFSDKWNAALVLNSLTRTAVPIFIMITGYLLLGRNETAGAFYKKRYMKILPPFLAYSLFYHLYLGKQSLSAFPLEFFTRWSLYRYHLWYMYMLCGLYFVLPFLQKIWNNSTQNEKTIIVASWFIIFFIPTTLSALSIPSYSIGKVFFLTFTPLWGYVFFAAFIKDSQFNYPRIGLCLFAVFSGLIIYFTRATSLTEGKPTEIFFNSGSFFVGVASIGIFMYFYKKRIHRARNIIIQLSNCSFGIYLIHVFMIWRIDRWMPSSFYSISPWCMIILLSVLVFVSSFLVVYLLRKIKGVRLFVG